MNTKFIYSTYGTLVDELVSDSMDPELPELELPSAANASRCCNRTSLRIVVTSKRVSNSKNPVRPPELEADAVSISTRPET